MSSDTETGMVDCGVGTIVWVRRRNGSWWPGKILGPDELSASPLMSPRSGTPVKLLGREDANVCDASNAANQCATMTLTQNRTR
ncbi:unnamed protein product [Lactuca virosa]|uniref:PWWP domain-containing protein n=1 Tax=Lactuca virosa TaxID=75947 RepID=A0AAU9PUB8_9ASTR|nr:unnamed protein product [Lactuca virosa]